MAGMRSAVTGGLVVGLVLGGAACGRGDSQRIGAFCARIEAHDGMVPADDPGAAERLVRRAPYEIADEVALVAASHRAQVEGTGPVATAERLEAAETEISEWVATGC